MTYYFFHHPLDSRNGIPGRYAFRVTGILAAQDGTANSDTFAVAVDGFGEDRVGENVDPCVFASPHAIVHSFCKIDRRGGNFCVPRTRRILSEIVRPGDTIFYGHLRTANLRPTRIYVDTVLVVASTLSLPTVSAKGRRGKRNRFVIDSDFAEAVLASTPVPPGDVLAFLKGTDLWHFNLKDALAEESYHGFTGIRDHKIIVGVSADPRQAGDSLQARTTSFVPLVETHPNVRALPTCVDEHDNSDFWGDLCDWVSKNPRMARGMKPPTEMPESIGVVLYDLVRKTSGRGGTQSKRVGLPPFKKLAVHLVTNAS